MAQLKKGSVLLEFQYKHHCDSINAENFKVNANENHTTICFSLKPVGSNQKDYEKFLHDEKLESVVLNNEQLLSNLEMHLKAYQTTSMELNIRSQNKTLSYDVQIGATAIGRLPLMVKKMLANKLANILGINWAKLPMKRSVRLLQRHCF